MITAKKILITGISFGILSLIIFLMLSLLSSSQIHFYSILLGDFIVYINFVVGLVFVQWGINKSEKKFLASVYGGLMLRLIVLISLVVIILIFLEINEISFIFSVLFFYFFYLIIEIIYLNLREK